MITKKKMYIIKGLIIYLLVLSILVCTALLIRINEILSNFNLFFFGLLLLNIFIVAFNFIFLFRKNLLNDYKMVLLTNSIFSLISGLNLRFFGYIVNNNLGTDFSIYFTKNNAGVDYGLRYDLFNFDIALLRYDDIKLTGFSIQINLIMLLVSSCLFYFFNNVRKSKVVSHTR
jgi:hypothetical protein